MPELNYQERLLHSLIWFLRKRIHEILSELNQAERAENMDISDILKHVLETVTLTEYLDAPTDEKIAQLSQLNYFVQTLSGTDIHGNEACRRGPEVD